MERQTLLLAAALFAGFDLAKAQNAPNASGLPSGALTGVLSYPTDFNQTPNVAPTTYNYTRQYTPLVPMTSIPSFDNTLGLPVLVHTTFQDGFGNPVLEIKRTNQQGDIVTPFYNRPSKTSASYLSFLANPHSKFINAPFSAQKNYYGSLYSAEGYTAYAKTVFYSDSGRPTTKSYSPGAAFVGQERGTTTTTDINCGGELFKIEYSNGTLCKVGTYPAGTLILSRTTGQHGQQSITFTDRSGRLLCKKAYAGIGSGNNGWLETYFIYNSTGKLIYVIPPKASKQLLTSNCISYIDTLCYSYTYNKYGEIIGKKTPGKANEEIVIYDARHRPVLSQSSLLRSQNKIAFTIYDDRSRIVFAGTLDNSGYNYNASTWQSTVTSSSSSDSLINYLKNGYTGGGYPNSLTACDIQLYNYYDDYINLPAPANGRNYSNLFANDFQMGTQMVTPQPYYFTSGKLVGTKTKIITNGMTNNFVNSWIISVLFYDEKSRVIQTQTLNPWNSSEWDISAVQYNFSGQPVLLVSTFHAWSGSNKDSSKIQLWNDYDQNTGILLETKQKIDLEPWKTITKIYTNALGQVTAKKLGSIESQAYSYNLRGQLKGVNESQYLGATLPQHVTFAELLKFETGFDQRRFDGTLTGFEWRTSGSNKFAYGYSYDSLGRMTNAEFNELITSWGTLWTHSYKNFSVAGISYDENGNMLSMQQFGYDTLMQPTLIDEFTYNYDQGNRLLSVTDNGGKSPIDDFDNSLGTTSTYTYDADGNLKSDALKDIIINYNHLDLPLTVSNSVGHQILNIYDAAGTLIQKTITTDTTATWRYWGPYVFRNDSLLYILHEEGRAKWIADSNYFKYDYFVKDHLGNVRTVVTSDYTPMSSAYLATHEVASANIENIFFENLSEVTDTKPLGSPTDLSERLNGSEEDRRIGAAIILRVMAGDKIDLSVCSYHREKEVDDNYTDPGVMLETLLGTLATGTGGFNGGEDGNGVTLTEGMLNSTNFSVFENIKSNATNTSNPRAFLNYLIFDEDFNLNGEISGARQVGATNNAWDYLSLPSDLEVIHNGYIVIYLSCEEAMDVHFDNLNIVHYNGRLLEEQHYYPHGLLIQKSTAANAAPENRYQYQGKEIQPDFGLQLYDFHTRQYDPQIGRFWGIDPLDQFPSGYTGMGNDPANNIDPSGMWVNSHDGNGVQRKSQFKLYDIARDREYWERIGSMGYSRIERDEMIARQQRYGDVLLDLVGEEEAGMGIMSQVRKDIKAFQAQRDDKRNSQKSSRSLTGLLYVGFNGKLAVTPEGKLLYGDQIDKYEKNRSNEVDRSQGTTLLSSGKSTRIFNSALAGEGRQGKNGQTKEHIDYIIIANNTEGAKGYGHSAMLIGNEEHGYQFYSKEGRDDEAGGSSNNASSGGPAILRDASASFNNFDEFLENEQYAEYDRFIMIPISHSKGVEVLADMKREAYSHYNLIFNNCGHAVNSALQENGFRTGHFITPNSNFFPIYFRNRNATYFRR